MVAEILLIAITVVLAAVLYIMASGLLGSRSTPQPVVALAGPRPYSGGSYNATLIVGAASQALTMANYKFNIAANGSYGNATTFGDSGVAIAIRANGVMFRVTWVDVDGGGTLSQGDEILVTGNGVGLLRHTNLDFVLVFWDGNQITHLAWTSP